MAFYRGGHSYYGNRANNIDLATIGDAIIFCTRYISAIFMDAQND
ncbi:hypothetical protein [Arenicella chitinivorans]|nr:hypothetical protein [Arenicella chitinivorans]